MRNDLNYPYYQKVLEQRCAALKQTHAMHVQESAPVELDQTSVGRLSRMDAMQQQAMAQAGLRRAEIEQQRIQAALNRLASGEYGYCVKCDEEISEGRLKIDPAALICIDCARKSEGK